MGKRIPPLSKEQTSWGWGRTGRAALGLAGCICSHLARSSPGPKPQHRLIIPSSTSSKIVTVFGKATGRCSGLEHDPRGTSSRIEGFGSGKRRWRKNLVRGGGGVCGQTHKRQQQKGREWPVTASAMHGTESWTQTVAGEIGAGTRKK